MAGGSYPRGVPISINYPEIPLYAFLENSARKYPNRDAVIFYGRRITYEKLWDSSLRLAAALRGLGVEKGDRVGLLLPNVPQFITAYNATLAAGGIVVPINPLNPVEEIEREIGETEAKALIALDRLADKTPGKFPGKTIIAEAAAHAPWHLRLLSRLRRRNVKAPEGALSLERLVEGPPLRDMAEVDPKEDSAVILYTSGTTGQPKGVVLTHRNLVANALQSYHWLRGWGFSEKPQLVGWPVVLCAVPFFHSYGMTVAMNESVQFGCTLVLVPEPGAETIMEAIQRHRCTHFPAIPRFIREILRHSDLNRYDLTSLTSCVSGGASIDPKQIEGFVEASGARFYQGYGRLPGHRGEDRRHPARGGRDAHRGEGGAPSQRPPSHEGLLEGPGGDRQGPEGRLAPHRGHSHSGRGGLHLRRRQEEGQDNLGGPNGLAIRGGGGLGVPSERGEGGGHRRTGPFEV
jgi:long-chain acyl-CoA synthetase